MGVRINMRAALQQQTRRYTDFQRRQVPFAISLMLNSLAGMVRDAETEALSDVFDNPTPFTRRAFGVRSATKHNLTAYVFAKDIQAQYLEPWETGGRQVLGSKRAILTPKGARVNQYGNLPKGRLATLKAQSNVFIGAVKTKKGETINGVWRRPARRNGKSTLKLMIRFSDPAPVPARLHFADRALDIVRRNGEAEWDKAMAVALATAR
jgi:hypothetical protein